MPRVEDMAMHCSPLHLGHEKIIKMLQSAIYLQRGYLVIFLPVCVEDFALRYRQLLHRQALAPK
jgi:nicotinic acid mononucleotide adenylyltransferase